MVRILLFTATLILINYLLFAQANVGIKAGFNYSTAKVLVKDVNQEAAYKSDYSFGIMLKVPFENALHFSPYIVYNRRGYTYLPDSGLKKIENTIHYIDVAPGLTFDLLLKRKSLFIIGFSPVFGFAVSGKEEDTFSNDSVSTKKMVLDFSNYGAYDVGLTGNIGFRFNKILIEATYYYGLANIENNEANKRNIQNRMFNLSIGYYIK